MQNLFISNFKNFFAKVIIPPLFILFAIGVVFSNLFENHIILRGENLGSYKVNRIINSNNQDEISIFGSSRAEASIVPKMLGSNYFNYGLSGSGDNVWLFFLEEELRKTKTTPIIINFDLDGLNNKVGDIGYYIYNASNENVRYLLGTDYEQIFRIPFLKYYGRYEKYLKTFLNEKLNLTRHYDNGGTFEIKHLTEKKFKELIIKRKNSIHYFENDRQLEEKFLSLAKSTKRDIVILITPYHKSFYYNFKNISDSEKFLNTINKLENVTVLNFGNVNYPDSYFANTTHLNYEGAKHFTVELKNALKSNIKFFSVGHLEKPPKS